MHRSIDLGAAQRLPTADSGVPHPPSLVPSRHWSIDLSIHLSTYAASICLSRCCARSSSPPSLTSRRSGATTRLALSPPHPHPAHLASPHPTSSPHLPPQLQFTATRRSCRRLPTHSKLRRAELSASSSGWGEDTTPTAPSGPPRSANRGAPVFMHLQTIAHLQNLACVCVFKSVWYRQRVSGEFATSP